MSNDWIKVFTTTKEHLVALAQQSLDKEDINSIQMNKKDSSYHFGSVDIMVEKKDYDKAVEIIKQFKKDLDLE